MSEAELERWQVLPAARKNKVDWALVADEARAHPGEWIESPVSVNPSVAAQMRKGRYAAIKPEEFEVVTRRDQSAPHRSFIYVRVKR